MILSQNPNLDLAKNIFDALNINYNRINISLSAKKMMFFQELFNNS